MKQKGVKKQHFVPQLLLRRFADENEQLFVYDLAADKSFPSTVRDTGHQNHFLTMPELDGKDGPGAHFEKLFQTYEGPAMTALRDNQILYDREGDGEFFQVYTHAFDDRFFFEIVERRNYHGFGAANAAIRLAAQTRESRLLTMPKA